jgi:hypothetical protein
VKNILALDRKFCLLETALYWQEYSDLRNRMQQNMRFYVKVSFIIHHSKESLGL